MIKTKHILLFFITLPLIVMGQNQESIITKKEKLCSAGSFAPSLMPQEFHNLCSYQIDSSGFYYQQNINSIKSAAFYDSLRTQSKKHGKFTQQLTELLIQPKPLYSSLQDTASVGKNFNAFDGKIVRHIKINVHNIFSTSSRTMSENTTLLKSMSSLLHTRTHESVIKQNMFIQSGSFLDASELADNARYLRQLPFIQDAKILPVLVPNSSDSIDLVVITTDMWSLDMKNTIKTVDEGYTFVENKNTLGTGVHTGLRLDYKKNQHFQHDHAFFIRSENILGTFMRGQVNWLEFNGERFYGAQLDRRFFTRGARTAGGIQFYKSIEKHPEYRQNISTTMHVADAWFGKAFPHVQIGNLYPVISTRYVNRQAAKSPHISHELGKYWEFRDMQLLLGNFSLTKRDYLTSFLVSKFGVTEDIPLGFNWSTTQGMEKNQYGVRGYAGSSINWATMLNKRYLYTGCAFGTFYKHNHLHEGTLSLAVNSFSKLYPLKSMQVRHFTGVHYLHGFRQPPGQMVNFVYPKAIRGFYDPWVAGTKRLVFNYEMVTFLPFDFYGFRFAGFTFADVGVINSERSAALKNTFAAVGLGFRIRNDHFVIKTMQFAITLLADLQTQDTRVTFGYNGKEIMNYYDFENAMPDIVRFE